jgi:hypothetical protein
VATFVRLRVALADRPGALARVASTIAGFGGNIISVDVQLVDPASAIDDLGVEFDGEPDLLQLREELSAGGAATVISHQQTQPVDPIVGILHRVVQLVDGSPGDPVLPLADAVAELCSSPVVWVSSAVEARRYQAGRLALEHDGAVAMETNELPEHLAERLAGDVCVLAVPDPERLNGERVIFVARSVTNPFTSTEIARIEALTALYSRIERLLSGSETAESPPGHGR